MTMVVAAPPWPIRVLAIESPTAPLRGRTAEFRHRGISLSRPADALSALREIAKEPGSIVLVPTDMSGIPLLDFIEIVVALAHAPVVVGVAPDAPPALVAQCLDLGAVGMIALPITPSRLAAVLSPLHRALDREPEIDLQCSRITLSPAEHRVLVGQTEVHLSPKEFDVLRYLMQAFPRVIPVDELVHEFADGDKERTLNVRIAIYRIRTKLTQAAPGHPPLIETLRGIGYRIAG